MSTFTINKSIEMPAHNAFVDTWDVPVNADWALIDLCLGSSVTINTTGLSGLQTLATNQYQPLTIILSGTPTAAITYRVPSGVGGLWLFVNNTSGGFTVGMASAAGGATISIAAGTNTIVSCDGSASGMKLAVATPPAAAGANTQVQFNSGGTLAGAANFTFNGTTLTVDNLLVRDTSIFGNAPGDSVQFVGQTATIPNGLTFGTNLLVLANSTGQVAIGTPTPTVGSLLTVAGNIKITTGGLIFSDGTQLLSAAALAPGGSSGNVQFNNGLGGFGADGANFTYNNGTHTLSLNTLSVTTLTGTPAFTGAPTAPTAAIGTNSLQLATTAYVDRAAGSVPVAWTPADASGAGLVFANVDAQYVQIGNMVHVYFFLTFPSTADGTQILISGLPVPVPNVNRAIVAAILTTNAGAAAITAVAVKGSSTFRIFANNGPFGNNSAATFNFSGLLIYPAA